MDALGWTVGIESSEEKAEWVSSGSEGRGLRLNLHAKRRDTTATIQLRRDNRTLYTDVVLLATQPVAEPLDPLVNRKRITLSKCENEDQRLYSMLGFTCRDGDGLTSKRVDDVDDIDEFNCGFEAFCVRHDILLTPYHEVKTVQKRYSLLSKLGAVVPADAYELIAGLYVGHKTTPIMGET